MEKRHKEVVALLEAPETYTKPGQAQHLNRELTHVVDQLHAANVEWETATAKLVELEKAD